MSSPTVKFSSTVLKTEIARDKLSTKCSSKHHKKTDYINNPRILCCCQICNIPICLPCYASHMERNHPEISKSHKVLRWEN